jgi:hypothetical protein
MSYAWKILWCTLVTSALVLVMASCASTQQREGTGPLTPGMVEISIEKGITAKADILEVFGPPDQVTRRDDIAIWTYDKHNIQTSSRRDIGTLILYSAGKRSSSSSSTSTLLILYFDSNDVVYDYKLDTFKY